MTIKWALWVLLCMSKPDFCTSFWVYDFASEEACEKSETALENFYAEMNVFVSSYRCVPQKEE